MNILSINLLQAAAGTQPAGGGGMFWIMMILLFVIMWAFMIRPQRKQQKELEKFRSELKRGDKVVTAGGISGTADESKYSSWTSSRYGPLLAVLVSLEFVNEMR